MMRRILLRVAYDGTEYCGFQRQTNGLSVQQVLEEALSAWLKEDIRIMGASRTDAGVHALANAAAFDTETLIPGGKYAFGLNTSLPPDIRITGSVEVPADFHPRFTKTVKTYVYRIYNSTFENPLNRRYCLHCYGPLDLAAMQKAAAYLEGEHDFKGFASAGYSSKTTVRTLYEVSLERGEDDVISLKLTGNGFLYNMVRIIAGTLLEIGRGELPPEQVLSVLETGDRSLAGATAPAHGLTLMKISFPELENLNIFLDKPEKTR